MTKVLIVEDDPNIIELIALHLRDMDCEVTQCTTGPDGFNQAKNGKFALIILDIMLPEMDGIAVCQKLRALENFTPILMLTAKAEEFDKVMGLESGADDYMTKPFGIREFIARVKAILRRELRKVQIEKESTEALFEAEGLMIDKSKHKVVLNGTRLSLTPKEYDLLILLAGNPGHSYTRDQLLEQVWGYEFSGYEHTVNTHINRLRSKIETDINQPRFILTTWGVGYRFSDEILPT